MEAEPRRAIDDGSEKIEVRIARCRAETGLPRPHRDRQALQRASPRAPAWTVRPAIVRNRTNQPHLAASYGPQKGFAMFSRVRDRLKRLKDQITPEGACSCSSGLRSRAFRPMPSSLRHSRTRTVSAHTTLSLRWSTKDKRCKGPLRGSRIRRDLPAHQCRYGRRPACPPTIDARRPLREFQQTTGHTPVDPGLAAPVA